MPSEAWLGHVDFLVGNYVMEWEYGGSNASHWQHKGKYEGFPVNLSPHRTWSPTRNREQAMMVLEQAQIAVVPTALCDTWRTLPAWCATWRLGCEDSIGPKAYYTPREREEYEAYADTLMLAICLASLKKAGVEVPADA